MMGVFKSLRRIDKLAEELHEKDTRIILKCTGRIRGCLPFREFGRAMVFLDEIEGQVNYFSGWVSEILPKDPDMDDRMLWARTCGVVEELGGLVNAVKEELKGIEGRKEEVD